MLGQKWYLVLSTEFLAQQNLYLQNHSHISLVFQPQSSLSLAISLLLF